MDSLMILLLAFIIVCPKLTQEYNLAHALTVDVVHGVSVVHGDLTPVRLDVWEPF